MTNEADIEAMAKAIINYFEMNGYGIQDKDAWEEVAKAALAASPVEWLRAEMATAIRLIGEGHQDHAAERLKQALEGVKS